MSNSNLKTMLLRSTMFVTAAALTAPAFAQDTAATTAAEAAPDAEEIVVTGTLISNPNLVRSTPVTVTGADEIQLRQSNVAEEVLREIPGVVPSIGSAVNNGNGGASYVDLRGLGTFRNIVLLDGNRIAPSGLVGRVDLNNIPVALVERVEVLTGGASTTYGADAISGVVNFVTKQDFNGIDLSASEQITERGDGNTFRVDATIGGNINDGQGNVVLSIGYQQADPVYQGDRPYSIYNIDGNTANPAAAGSGTTVPTRFSVTGQPVQQINPTTGALVPTYATYNFNPFNLFQTPFERFNVYGAAHYDIADGFQIYTRGLFSKNTVRTILAPGGSFGEAITINYNNPYLPDAAATTFGLANGLTAAQIAAARAATGPTDPNYRTFTTAVSRRTPELGPRISTYTTNIFDYRLGTKFDITDSINFDLGGAYGESENNQDTQGNIRSSRLRQAALANNTTTCIDASNGCVPINLFGAEGSINQAMGSFIQTRTSVTVKTSLAQAHGVLSGDIGASTPWASEPIGFAVGGEYRNYAASQIADPLSQVAGEISGTGGAALNVAGGYDVKEVFGELVAPLVQDQPFFRSLTLEAGIRYSKYNVDAPTSPKYNTTTWKAGGSWEPVEAVKIRGNYTHAVRAPNINELFAPQQVGLTSLSTDPCASLNNSGARINAVPTGNLQAVCLAQGATAATLPNIQLPTAGQANQTSGGNLNLKPEKSNSYTLGLVLQPKEIDRSLSITVDYYNIKITGAIGTPTVQDALTACFGGTTFATANVTAASASDPACTLIRRNPLTGGLDGSPATTGGLFLALSNLGTAETDGIDVSANWSRDLDFAKLGLSFQGNYTMNSKYKATPTAVNRECVGLYSTSCGGAAGSPIGSLQPKFSWYQRTTLTFDPVDVSLLWRHIDSMKSETGALFSGAVPVQPGGATNPANGKTYNFNRIKAFDYFDLTGRVNVNENFSITASIQNLLDKQPPIVGSGIGTQSFNSGNTYPSTYDALGRRYAVTARLRY